MISASSLSENSISIFTSHNLSYDVRFNTAMPNQQKPMRSERKKSRDTSTGGMCRASECVCVCVLGEVSDLVQGCFHSGCSFAHKISISNFKLFCCYYCCVTLDEKRAW